MYYGSPYPKRSSSSSGLIIGLAVGGVVLVAIILSLISGRLASRPKPLTNAPSTFTHFASDGGYFSCAYPSGWTIAARSFDSRHDTPSYVPAPPTSFDMKMDQATFTNGGVRIEIMADNMQSLFQQEGSDGHPTPVANASKPADVLEAMAAMDRLTAQMSAKNYNAGPEQLFGCSMGSGTVVDFTGNMTAPGANASSSDAIHGFVATIMGPGETHVQVICISPQSNWPKARPIFVRVINSLAPAKS